MPHSANTSQQYFTNTQRDAIDAQSKDTIRDLNRRLAELAATEAQRKEIRAVIQRKQTEKRLGGRFGAALGRWAAGEEGSNAVVLTPEEEEQEAKERTTDEWRENVLWFLRSRLGAAVNCQRDMMERRVMREVEKSKSVLYKTSGQDGRPAGTANGVPGFDAEASSQYGRDLSASDPSLSAGPGSSAPDSGFTTEQLQQFAEENNVMQRHYENSLDQVRYVIFLAYTFLQHCNPSLRPAAISIRPPTVWSNSYAVPSRQSYIRKIIKMLTPCPGSPNGQWLKLQSCKQH